MSSQHGILTSTFKFTQTNEYILFQTCSEDSPLGRPRRRWVDNIRIYLGEVGWGDVDWIGLAKDRNRWRVLVNSVLNLRFP
jgi:hypothetical protein